MKLPQLTRRFRTAFDKFVIENDIICIFGQMKKKTKNSPSDKTGQNI